MPIKRMLNLSFLLLAAISAFPEDSVFKLGEHSVQPSPAQKSQLMISAGEKVIDFDVWSTGPEAIILTRTPAGGYKVSSWTIGSSASQPAFNLPAGFEAHAITCHPESRKVFLVGRRGGEYMIVAYQFASGKWQEKTLLTSASELRRLLVSPRPFSSGYDKAQLISHRLLFASKGPSGAFAIRTIMEEGGRNYQVLGPKVTYNKLSGADDAPPTENFVPAALPAAFHPAGHLLLWEDAQHCFHNLNYVASNWGKPSKLPVASLCGGSLTVTPNGMGLIHWKPREPGITLYFNQGKTTVQQAADYTFLSTPSSVPDGRGIVGLVQTPEGVALTYVPIAVPLPDVINAWMFTERADDQQLFSKNSGLLRASSRDQIYDLYDTESYLCGSYDTGTPTRPYLVTTDLFWEVYAAAYEGMFILQERQHAMPAFWAFIRSANDSAAAMPAGSPWPGVFSTLTKLRNPAARNDPEVQRILKAAGPAVSPVTGKNLDYGEMKPRGHYEGDDALGLYFQAFRYLTSVSHTIDNAPLRSLPQPVKTEALRWIGAYQGFLAPASAPLVWKAGEHPPAYALHPETQESVFPLSWGFDNEVLNSTVYHDAWPAAQQIKGPSGLRLMPSGLDVAAALGGGFARGLLADELRKYPPLATVLDNLQARFKPDKTSLYSAWISALAVQWANNVSFPGESKAEVWQAKRLQTGLASWATLRHATVLVNAKSVAECGEGGLEELLLRPPRGYVEPDPATLAAIAGLFDETARMVSASAGSVAAGAGNKDQRVRQALLRKLNETAAETRKFQKMAEKEIRGEPLSTDEYDSILYVGRLAEHHFLVYKTLAAEDLAVANPDPMTKIADVAQGPAGNLEVAVGTPLEWNQVVPYFGRREIVRGSVYSYYEFVSPRPLTDSEWRDKRTAAAAPEWIKPFLSPGDLSCPARNPF